MEQTHKRHWDLKSVEITDSVTKIGKTAFKKCHADLKIKCSKNSYAYTFANENVYLDYNYFQC